jgi:hypothetical protein
VIVPKVGGVAVYAIMIRWARPLLLLFSMGASALTSLQGLTEITTAV